MRAGRAARWRAAGVVAACLAGAAPAFGGGPVPVAVPVLVKGPPVTFASRPPPPPPPPSTSFTVVALDDHRVTFEDPTTRTTCTVASPDLDRLRVGAVIRTYEPAGAAEPWSFVFLPPGSHELLALAMRACAVATTK